MRLWRKRAEAASAPSADTASSPATTPQNDGPGLRPAGVAPRSDDTVSAVERLRSGTPPVEDIPEVEEPEIPDIPDVPDIDIPDIPDVPEVDTPVQTPPDA